MLGRSPYLQRFRESNNKLFLGGKNVLVVGGTGGIGAAAAVRFAQLGADVTIAGRNKEAGDSVIAQMRSVAPQRDGFNPKFDFQKVDITVMSDVSSFSNEYTNSQEGRGLNVLVITSGGLNLGSRQETPDGIEHNFAICYLGRFLLINRLLPNLLKDENSRVISVLSAGRAGPINLDDPQMKKEGSYSKVQSEKFNSIANDYMMGELTKRYSKTNNSSFFHVIPGMVATDIYKNSGGGGVLNSVLRTLSSCIGQQPSEYAETVVHIATSPEFGPELSGKGLSRDAEPVQRIAAHDTPGAAESLWEYSAKISGFAN